MLRNFYNLLTVVYGKCSEQISKKASHAFNLTTIHNTLTKGKQPQTGRQKHTHTQRMAHYDVLDSNRLQLIAISH